MNIPLRCPSSDALEQLRLLIDDPSLSDSLRAVEDHIEVCERCQMRLEKSLDQDRQRLEELLPEPIPGYRVLKLLGRGGHACVFLATELATERQVALKLVAKSSAFLSSDIDAWRSEILVSARMDHVNLVRLYSVQETEHSFILVFEFIAGGTLQSLLVRTWNPLEIAKLVLQIAQGLAKIHSMGFLHLDLKPSNILLDLRGGDAPEYWVPKISDFGISLAVSKPPSLKPLPSCDIQQHHGLGTLEYMAPEQALGIRELLTPRSDIFALGRLMEHMLNTTRASAGRESLQRICARCTQIDPDRRFASAAELIDALEGWIGSFAPSPLRRTRLLPTTSWRLPKHTTVTLLAILFATFLAIGRIGAIGSIGHTEATGQPNQIANQLDSASANWDLATWISKLDTPPEAITKSDASALANSSVHWTSVSIASRLVQEQPEQALRYAVLQRSAAERISTKIDTRHMPLARELMTNAIKLLKALRQCHPNDSSLLRELIATHYGFGRLRYHTVDIPRSDEYFQNRIGSLEEVCKLIDQLDNPVQQVYWSTRVLDELRVSRRTAGWVAQPTSLEAVLLVEQSCGELLRRLQDNRQELQGPDLTVRLSLLQSSQSEATVLEQLSRDARTGQSWLFAEDIPILVRELIATELGRPIFEKIVIDPSGIDDAVSNVCAKVSAQTGADEIVPLVFQEDLFRFVASVSTHHRLTNRMAQAHRIQSGYLAVCEACMKRFPDHPNLYLARSEAYLQAWKNELRNDDEKTAFESLLKSYADSRRALELAPNNPLAYHQVSDRLKRITRFQTEHSSLSDIAMIQSGPSSSLPQ